MLIFSTEREGRYVSAICSFCASGLDRGRRLLATLVVALLVVGTYLTVVVTAPAVASASDPCAAPTNPIVCENSKPGTPQSVWDARGVGDDTIQGFTTDTSTNVGGTVSFKVKTPATSYKIDIYRMGYYGGDGARLIGSSTTPVARTQPNCLSDATTGLVDCGNWAVSATWAVPSTAVSGVYIALLTRNDTGGQSNIPFIVRNDASTADVVYQTSDPTWQAYNPYGGSDFYVGSPAGRSYKVSYNRPYSTRSGGGTRDYVFANEYPMIRFMERNGYDMSYISGVDTDRAGALLKNHKVFVSVGHDEYWSAAQRANVESARDAGVNLAFFSGNEIYWKTRYEKSIDGSNTDYRTVVCYKETWANAKIDPAASSTATWRDGRFGPDGGVPENALSGTAYMANNTDLPIQVPAAQGKTRFWRGTTVANLAAGQTATMPDSTVGYESNEDLDNGYRPKGLIKLSTTTGPTPQYLTTYGPDVTSGNTTHNMTLYRADSGALVFSAGTIQYAWGLDSEHDGTQNAPDVRMQQATVNLFADMGAQPLTRMSALAPATASTDQTAPTSTITSPSANATLSNGTSVTVTGTATDTGGGIVAGVEVSTDSGSTWHPATGTTSWSYTSIVTGSGSVKVLSRATDDSANTETPSAGATVTVNCPCSLFGNRVPATPAVSDGSDTELGVRFVPQVNGVVTGIRFYKGTGNTGTHTGTLWSSTGTKLATGTFINETATGWQTLTLANPVTVTAGGTYVASYRAPNGRYADQSLFFDRRDHVAAPLIAPRSYNGSVNGVFASGGQFPTGTFNLDNYFVDVAFTGISGTNDNTPPVVSAITSEPAATSATISWTTDESATSVVKYGTSPTALTSTASVAGLSTGHSVFITGLVPTTQYYFRVTSADVMNNSATAPATTDPPATFTTTELGACPCTLFSPTSTPAAIDAGDSAAIEVGVKLVSSVSGYITGIRFYKASTNSGTHVATLWSSTGTALASATFRNESASGWQSVTFGRPVLVTAGTTYVASYKAPNGHYSADAGYFANDVTNGPWTAPAGSNGVFTYGGGFPTTSFNSGNYWVDAVFMTGTPPPDTTAPSISGLSGTPSSTSAKLSWSTNEPATSVVSYGTSPTALTQTATAAGLDTEHTVRLSGLSPTTTYYYRVTSADDAGNTSTSPVATAAPGTFATSALTCPCSLFAADATPGTVDGNDGAAIEVGVRLTASANGFISGVRFYKAAANTGTHVGSLWSASGVKLATGTFSNETASGWQSLTFSNPIAVTAGTDYVASYSAPAGHYSIDQNYFAEPLVTGAMTGNTGVYRYGAGFPTSSFNNANYWVDAAFELGSGTGTAPVISGLAVSVAGSTATVDWTTDVKSTSVVNYGTSPTALNSTVQSPALVNAHSVALTGLAKGETYYYRVTSFEASGRSTTSPATSGAPASFSLSCPCTLFDDAVPTRADAGDGAAIELGVRIVPSKDGKITGVRFYKSAANTGTHTGTLWSSTGTALATGTFGAETASGWQTLTFASAVPVTAGTTYVASYSAPNGHYAGDNNFFTTDFTNGPLTAPATNNGLFSYGTGFPTSSFNASNYWVDAVFASSVTDTAPPAVLSTTPASGASGVTGQTVTANLSEAVDPATLVFTVSNGTTAVPGTVTYNAGTNVATFTATSAFPTAATLTASLSATDLAGNAMASATTWQFATRDLTPPTVTSTVPASGATNVTAQTVTATFSKAIAPASLVFTVSNGATAVPGTATYNATTDVATFTPTAALPAPATLTASVKATDLSGNDMPAATTWQFTTKDSSLPTVTATTPVAGATDVALTTAPTATFSEAIDPASVVATLTPSGGAAKAITTAYNATTQVVTITPTTPLAGSTTYTVSITAADTAGNAMASPKTWQFSTPDTTPPTVTAVAASGSGTTATVTWTTNEASTSVVNYGTSATALTSTATVPGPVTAHSVPLSGLTANTRYYYRVVSADAAGNSVTSPATSSAAATYAPTTTPFTYSTEAQFDTGTSSNTYVGGRAGGEVVLAPSGVAQEFDGTTVPSSWTSSSLATGSSVSVASGQATVTGRLFRTTSTFASGRTLDAVLTLKAANNQWWGLTNGDFVTSGNSWAAFRTTSTGGLVAETRYGGGFFGVGAGTTTTNLSSALLGAPHRFTIDWTSSTVTYSVDGTVVATQSRAVSASMYVAARDATVDANPIAVDSVWLTPYASSGTWTSPVIDAGTTVKWGVFTPTATTPTGTGITYQYRSAATTGALNSAAWATIAAGATLPPTNRYLQYRANLTTGASGSATARTTTPTLTAVSVGYSVP